MFQFRVIKKTSRTKTYRTVLYSITLQWSTAQYSKTLYRTARHYTALRKYCTTQFSTVQHSRIYYNTVYTALHSTKPQHTVRYSTVQYSSFWNVLIICKQKTKEINNWSGFWNWKYCLQRRRRVWRPPRRKRDCMIILIKIFISKLPVPSNVSRYQYVWNISRY